MSDSGHGSVGTREQAFTALLNPRDKSYPIDKLAALAEKMKGEVDTVKDGPDPEENLWVPAGYTYFGQFIDHDLTFDNTSSLNPDDAGKQDRVPTNLRTPRLDLDCLYGDGPAAQPYMYAEDGATLLYGGTGQLIQSIDETGKLVQETASWDLLRAPNGRAIIGDKRNDENSIVCQIQLSFIKFHNAVVEKLKTQNPKTWNVPDDLFKSARNEVRWAYQRLVVEDFLPRIIKEDVLRDLQYPMNGKREYALYTEDKRANLPREFVAAAYRFGHSGVRTGYRLNGEAGEPGGTRLSIFPSSTDTNQDTDSLLGFDPLPKHHVIDDWSRFFPLTPPKEPTEDNCGEVFDEPGNGVVRLQYAYKLDPTLVDPLAVLPRAVAGTSTTKEAAAALGKDIPIRPDPQRPSLALLNLLRGNSYRLPSGQAVLAVLQERLSPTLKGVNITGLEPTQLCTRQPGSQDNFFKFEPIDPEFANDTPLWFYILAEAQAPLVTALSTNEFSADELLKAGTNKTQLGWVGGRIVAEVFYGLLDSDSESYVNAAPKDWAPIWTTDTNKNVIFANLLKFAAQPISCGFEY
jgi:hypothetical protein